MANSNQVNPRFRGFLSKRADYQPKNWNWEQSKAQILQLSRANARDWENSVFVEGFTALYYQAQKLSGTTCSCRATELSLGMPHDPEDDEQQERQRTADTLMGRDSRVQDHATTFRVTPSESVFGLSKSDTAFDQPDQEEWEIGVSPDATGLQDFLDNGGYEDGIDCPICFRLGVQPGYRPVNGHREMFTSLNMDKELVVSATVITEERPHRIQIEEDGYVAYDHVVPKYWAEIRVGLFNKFDAIVDGLFVDQALTVRLSRTYLDQRRGQTVRIYVSADSFTHLILDYFLDAKTQPVRISLPQLQKMRDYTKFISIPLTHIVIDNSVSPTNIHDILICEQLNLMWKITEINPLTMIDEYPVGWDMQGRLIQPTETVNTLRHVAALPLLADDPPPPPQPFVVLGTPQAVAYVGLSYASHLAIVEGIGPFVVLDSTLPSSIVANITGRVLTLSGLPVSGDLGTSHQTLLIKDMGMDQNSVLEFDLEVLNPVALTWNMPNGVVGVVYNGQFQATGGSGVYTWTIEGLPDGLYPTTPSTDGPVFAVGGAPSSSGIGTNTVRVRAADEHGQFAEVILVLTVTAVGPAPPVSSGDLNYTHNQNTASAHWIVLHNLGKYPSVTVEDSAGSVAYGAVTYLDLNSLAIDFSQVLAGKAFCN